MQDVGKACGEDMGSPSKKAAAASAAPTGWDGPRRGPGLGAGSWRAVFHICTSSGGCPTLLGSPI